MPLAVRSVEKIKRSAASHFSTERTVEGIIRSAIGPVSAKSVENSANMSTAGMLSIGMARCAALVSSEDHPSRGHRLSIYRGRTVLLKIGRKYQRLAIAAVSPRKVDQPPGSFWTEERRAGLVHPRISRVVEA